jgi:hypothetical protein
LDRLAEVGVRVVEQVIGQVLKNQGSGL